MYILRQSAAIAAFLFIIFLTNCAQPSPPVPEPLVLTYSCECTEENLLADITYTNGSNTIVNVEAQSLPWSVSIDLSDSFTGDAYLKAVVPSEEVFVAFLSGTANGDFTKKLFDSTVNFLTEGVAAGDIVYLDPSNFEYANILSVDDANTLSLDADLFPDGDEEYFIFREKTLTVKIIVDGTTVEEENISSEKILHALVQASIDR